MPRMDENGKAISPEKHDIVFDHVNFSYEQKPILNEPGIYADFVGGKKQTVGCKL